MRRALAAAGGMAFVLLGHAEAAHANEPPAPQTMLAQIAIVPIALALFSLSGAAALHDRNRKVLDLGDAADVRSRSRRGRLRILILAIVACILSGIHEGFALLLSPALAGYAVLTAVRMLRMSAHAPAGTYTRWSSRIGGVMLIPVAVFLASFSIMFFSEADSYRYPGDWYYRRTLERFWHHQKRFASENDGRHQVLDPDGMTAGGKPLDRELLYVTGLDALHRMNLRNEEQCTICYSADSRAYTVSIHPAAFLPWPYRWLTSRKSYFMDESGVIRVRKLSSPGEPASRDSPVLVDLGSQPTVGGPSGTR